MSPAPSIVGASAGSGKTTRLADEVIRHSARLEGLVAVTYTRKAHVELAGRIRQALVREGAYERATRLPMAFIGTVHSVCLRLLQELALDAGLSPYLEVLPDDRGRRLRGALEASLEPALIVRLNQLARRLELDWDARTQRFDWVRHVAQVMELARSNRIAADALPAMAERSTVGLLRLLPPPAPAAAPLDDAMSHELDVALARLGDEDDHTKATADTRTMLRALRRKLDLGELTWRDWVRIGARNPGAACRPAVAELQHLAKRVDQHPQLHRDLRDLTAGVFEAAGAALAGYSAWKARHRVVDYVDMIDRAMTLIEDPGIAAELTTRLELVVVDEFQDTSPLQLAFFTRLHHLAGRSVWVGDAKQCIFEYAGADPSLMDAVIRWVAAQGGATEKLTHNYRSRGALVDTCSEVFAQVFASHGMVEDEVRTSATRSEVASLALTPPFAVWWLEGASATSDAGAIAAGISRLLGAPEGTPVVERTTGETRPVRARDIGILVATNQQATSIAAALHRCGIRAAIPRDGLLSTPEGVLLDAALRWLVSPHDRLALATLEALAEWNDLGPDAWLERVLHAGGEAEPPTWLQPLERLRTGLGVMTPAEVVDRALHLLDARTRCARWPDPQQRLGNLEALRALAAAYEDRCARQREAATVTGLLRYFEEARRPTLDRGEERAFDEQLVLAEDDAVTVSTYHRAKGLEWPVVVLASLDRSERRDAFDLAPESDRTAFDPSRPLAGRWIRYWPWPFGVNRNVPLASAARSSSEGVRVADREKRERARLLYVGFTRARDHLVLAARTTARGASAAWLDELCDAAGAPLLTLPVDAPDESVAAIRVRCSDGSAREVPCRVSRLAEGATASSTPPPPRRFARPTAIVERLPFRIAPSSVTESEPWLPRYRVGHVERIHPGIRLRREPASWEALGAAVHGFLAADLHHEHELRVETALRLLQHDGLRDVIDVNDLLRMSSALDALLQRRWAGARSTREVPVSAFLDGPGDRRRIDGVIDLLLATQGGAVIVDHKTYPAPSPHAIRRRAADFAPQLGAYEAALRQCDQVVAGRYLHFPIAGAWVELVPVAR